MKILHVTPELAHVTKVGGLADVVHSLSIALREEAIDMSVILPLYDENPIEKKKFCSLEVPFENKLFPVTIWQSSCDGIPLFLVDPEANFFRREKVYGCADDTDRFVFFCASVAEFLKEKASFDILNLHDWPTALLATMIKKANEKQKVVLTLHNLEHQGRCPKEILSSVGFRRNGSLIEKELTDPRYPEVINLLLAGILYADALNTVSPTYSQEIQTREFGHGLEAILQSCSGKLQGILNGIDTTYWNPADDPHLVAHYSATCSERDIISAKEKNRNELSRLMGLELKNSPLFVSVTRLAEQKGPELIDAAIDYVKERGGQFALLGSIADPRYEKTFRHKETSSSSDPDIAVELDTSEHLAHLIYSAADFLLIPSHFEPCGLTQMIGMRYGTIPIARKTGGLTDTVFDLEDRLIEKPLRNGFTFRSKSNRELFSTIDRAFSFWEKNLSGHRSLQRKVMNIDWSWKKTAPLYLSLYRDLGKQQISRAV